MNHKLQRILVLLLVAALVVALPAFSAAAADVDPVEEEPKAAGDAASAAPPLTNLTLKVHKGNITELPDLKDAAVTFDLYKIADAVADPAHGATFKFDNVNSASGLASDALDYDNLPKATDDPSTASTFWEGIRSTAATSILPEGAAAYAPAASKAAGEDFAEITPLAGGLYLIVARGTEASYADYWDTNEAGEVVTKVFSGVDDEYVFTYLPQLVVLPGTENGTTAGGKWVKIHEVYMKPSQALRLGNLKITKTLENIQAGSQATFVFHVLATRGSFTYEVDVSLTFSAGGDKTYEIRHVIPVGADVTVTEEYDGTRFTVDRAEKSATIPAPDKDESGNEAAASVEFTNTYNGKVITGYGIENRFKSDGKDWVFTQDPDPVIEGPNDTMPVPKEEVAK